jgi:hypothetical protein
MIYIYITSMNNADIAINIECDNNETSSENIVFNNDVELCNFLSELLICYLMIMILIYIWLVWILLYFVL